MRIKLAGGDARVVLVGGVSIRSPDSRNAIKRSAGRLRRLVRRGKTCHGKGEGVGTKFGLSVTA
jgi:hypothetical protein